MTVGCTRCGATQEGDILNVVVAFTFKHKEGCGQGVGPLAVLPSTTKKPKTSESKPKKTEGKKDDIIVTDEAVEKPKPKVEKIKVFGNNDD